MRKNLSPRDLVQAVRLAAKFAREHPDPNPIYVEALDEAAEVLEAFRKQGPFPRKKRVANTGATERSNG